MKHSNSILTKYFTFFVAAPASMSNDIENGEAYGVFHNCTWFSLLLKYWDPVESECLDCAHEKENT